MGSWERLAAHPAVSATQSHSQCGATRGPGVRRGVPGMSPGNHSPCRRGNLRVAIREWGPWGAGGLIGLTGLTHHQVTRRRPAK